MKRIFTIEYGSSFAAYWMYYAFIASFSSAFLLDRGYSNSEIGIILAVASGLAVFIQPLLADLSDRSKKLGAMEVTAISALVMMILTVGFFIFTKKSVALWTVFVLLNAWELALQPLLNSLARKLSELGEPISFGICRGMGSLGYAVLVMFLGTLVENRGVGVLPVTGELTLAALVIALFMMRRTFRRAEDAKRHKLSGEKQLAGSSASPETDINEYTHGEEKTGYEVKAETEHITAEDEEEINLVQFIRRNKLFLLLNFACLLLMFQNQVFNNFLLQVVEGVGGDAEDLGRIYSVMAFLEMPGLFLYDRIRRKIGVETLLKIGALAFLMKTIVIWLADSVAMIYAGHIFQAFSFPIFLPAIVEYISLTMSKGEAVKGQSLYTTFLTISGMIASVAGGVLLDYAGPRFMLMIVSIITVAGLLAVCILINVIRKRRGTVL